jgi:NADH dehydrogenase (ubiquinone) Fe-S protein 4
MLSRWHQRWRIATSFQYSSLLRTITKITETHLSDLPKGEKPQTSQHVENTSSDETSRLEQKDASSMVPADASMTSPTAMPEGSVYRTDTAYLTGVPPKQAQRTVLIYQPAKTAMQSGTFNTRYWKLRFEPQEHWENPLMGWISSADPTQAMQVDFDSKEDAIRLAEKNGWKYKVIEPHLPLLKRKAYADNFRYEPRKLRLIRTK